MIEMREHPLSFAAMVVIVADCTEDKAVVGFVDPVLVMSLRFEQGIACVLCIPFEMHSAGCDQAVKSDQFKKCGVTMLFDQRLDAIETLVGHRVPVLAGHERLSYEQ